MANPDHGEVVFTAFPWLAAVISSQGPVVHLPLPVFHGLSQAASLSLDLSGFLFHQLCAVAAACSQGSPHLCLSWATFSLRISQAEKKESGLVEMSRQPQCVNRKVSGRSWASYSNSGQLVLEGSIGNCKGRVWKLAVSLCPATGSIRTFPLLAGEASRDMRVYSTMQISGSFVITLSLPFSM